MCSLGFSNQGVFFGGRFNMFFGGFHIQGGVLVADLVCVLWVSESGCLLVPDSACVLGVSD